MVEKLVENLWSAERGYGGFHNISSPPRAGAVVAVVL